jgi:Tfp pilus assembly protein PilW
MLFVMLLIQQNGDKFCWNTKCLASPVYSAYLKPVEGAVPPLQQLSNKCDLTSPTVTPTTGGTAAATTATLATGTTATANGVSSSSSSDEVKSSATAVEPDADPMVVDNANNDDSTDTKKDTTKDNGVDDSSVRTHEAIAPLVVCNHLTLCQPLVTAQWSCAAPLE